MRHLRIGLTGGIGAGKSESAKIFASLGALVIDMDGLAREALARGTAGLAKIRSKFPYAIRPDGSLDRAALGVAVFSDPEARKFVNNVVHPYVRMRANQMEATAKQAIVVRDIPLLFETGGDSECDAIVVVTAPREVRIERVRTRSSFTREEVEQRMATQIDPAEAAARADFVIDNDGSLTDLVPKVSAVYETLLERWRSVGSPR